MGDSSIANYWKNSATDALDTADKLFASKKYHHSLFFLHLAVEKLLKAIYVQRKNEAAPVGHDLIRLAEKAKIALDEKMMRELAEISTFNVAARYDDYKFKFYKKATYEFTLKWQEIGKRLFKQFSLLNP